LILTGIASVIKEMSGEGISLQVILHAALTEKFYAHGIIMTIISVKRSLKRLDVYFKISEDLCRPFFFFLLLPIWIIGLIS
jgi:Mn2+/Fe2+ NRAMP family transporter